MSSALSDLSTTALSNGTKLGQQMVENATPPSAVNNAVRGWQAYLAMWMKDNDGSVASGGTATAVTATLNQGFTAYGTGDGQIKNGERIAIKMGSAATGAATINVNALGAKAIRRDGDTAISANDWLANATVLLRYDTAYNAAAGAWVLLNAASNAFVVRSQVFTASGTYTPNANMLYCIIECIGGGGGGGGVATSSAGQINMATGGGSGGYSRAVKSAATIGASQVVTIGAAGSAGPLGSPGTGGNGGNTSVGSLCVANGGGGGVSIGTSSGPGGLGGPVGTGDFTARGTQGGGAGGATISTVSLVSGYGAPSALGGGVSGVGNAGGATGLNYGAGGSGAASFSTSGATTGGAGAAGLVIITEFCTA